MLRCRTRTLAPAVRASRFKRLAIGVLAATSITAGVTACVPIPSAPQPAGQTSFGSPSSALGASVALVADTRVGSTYRLDRGITATSFNFYAAGGRSNQSFWPLIYSTDGRGKPVKLLKSGLLVEVKAGKPAGWVNVAMSVQLPPGNYVLALESAPVDSGKAQIYYAVSAHSGHVSSAGFSTQGWSGYTEDSRRWAFSVSGRLTPVAP